MGRQTSSSGKIESNWTASDDDLVFVGSMSTKRIHLAVLDSNAFMHKHNGEDNLISFAETFCSVPEITGLLSFLPFTIHELEPLPESVRIVKDFAFKTGDLGRLSDVDLKLIALVYTLESLLNGTKHLTMVDKDRWMLTSLSESNIACITSNLATQNVILKMGLRLVAPRPIFQIYEMRRYVLKCNACSIFTVDIGRTSCGNCGDSWVILHKASVTVIPGSNEKNEKIETVNRWCNMPLELLDLIFNKLCYADRIRFRKVCKDWFRPIGSRNDNELPWIMWYKSSDPNPMDITTSGISEIVLFDPIHKRIHKTLDSRNMYSKLFSNLRICGTQSGWLILRENNTGGWSSTPGPPGGCIKIFLYNLFTGKLFKLPALLCPRLSTMNDKVLFSSTKPTSPDCVFVVVHLGYVHYGMGEYGMGVLGFSTYRNGDKDWKTKMFYELGYELLSIRCLCTSKGICYIAFDDGKLGSICLENQEWNWLVEYPCWERRLIIVHLVEFNGGLLSVKHYYDFGYCEVHRFKFEEKERGWIEETSLGDKALFLDFCGGYVRSAFGDASDFAGAIVRIPKFLNFSQVVAYSLEEKKFAEKVGAYDWMETKDFGCKIFIEPPYA